MQNDATCSGRRTSLLCGTAGAGNSAAGVWVRVQWCPPVGQGESLCRGTASNTAMAAHLHSMIRCCRLRNGNAYNVQWLIVSLIISCRNKGCGYGGWCVSSDLAASAAVRAPHSYLCGLGCCYTAISVTSYYGRARVPLQGRRKLRSFLAARPGTSPVRCSSRRAPSDATGN